MAQSQQQESAEQPPPNPLQGVFDALELLGGSFSQVHQQAQARARASAGRSHPMAEYATAWVSRAQQAAETFSRGRWQDFGEERSPRHGQQQSHRHQHQHEQREHERENQTQQENDEEDEKQKWAGAKFETWSIRELREFLIARKVDFSNCVEKWELVALARSLTWPVPSKTEEESSQCTICFDYKIDAVMIPCGHQFCSICTFQVAECPVCKVGIVSRLRTFR